MLSQEKENEIKKKWDGVFFTTKSGTKRCVSLWKNENFDVQREISKKKFEEIEERMSSYGIIGIKGLGLCSHPGNKWPLTTILEETDEYILASCDAGCATILVKRPPRKIKKKKKEKVELSKTADGRIVEKRKSESIFEID